MKFAGKTVLITGGTGELGRAVTKYFLSEGADVADSYYSDQDAAEFTELFPRAVLLKGDLSKEGDVRQAFQSFLDKKKRLDILCNLVGGYMSKKEITELTEKEWDFMFALNLKTCFLCTRQALQIMKAQKFGRIINVSAMAGLTPSAGRGAYGISKAAVATFTKIAGEETKAYADSSITVNAIAPSILLTESNKRSATEKETRQWVTLEQAAEVIGFLASDEAAAINGETLPVYGRISN